MLDNYIDENLDLLCQASKNMFLTFPVHEVGCWWKQNLLPYEPEWYSHVVETFRIHSSTNANETPNVCYDLCTWPNPIQLKESIPIFIVIIACLIIYSMIMHMKRLRNSIIEKNNYHSPDQRLSACHITTKQKFKN